MFKFTLIVGLLLLAACGESPKSLNDHNSRAALLPAPPLGPDFRDTLDGKCLANSITPVTLNDYEDCLITELSRQCNPQNDCLISCLVSGQGRQIGGGCWHMCFSDIASFNAYHEPSGAARCRSLDPHQVPNNSFKPNPLRGAAWPNSGVERPLVAAGRHATQSGH